MQQLGASNAAMEAYLANEVADDDFAVLPENMPIVRWFIEVEDLYRWNGPVCLGLDTSAVHADAKMAKRRFTKEQYKGLRLMARIFADEATQRMMKKS